LVFKIILNNDSLFPIIVLYSVKVLLTHPKKYRGLEAQLTKIII
jgi:hypothetical protein